ncbi:MAG TPA: hypothetical protein DEG17_19800 [Cyanobacteria bacterium UBA11149]|nr:hypothetical protein [Cyanobacteria bacterium UBA11367]HBE60886.1 hypothetical protein [Cyanobacteria bacterium UBA11366]HBK62492.1 hypothetical protein [Cyanobacteria bacterium UBA11166]HBR74903.1 hypothetical protein [Cyanobacteria bacterium UBA11159]HBS72720.1 hypothetical protein [Cyanobacteria bacterium UBA11153]HBW91044.1 hypothetical protein [Cyanobacteria bacterium UBA11149]HCA97424.1 hypothetical protein [Cyanobacteria bacterium UBA9226]
MLKLVEDIKAFTLIAKSGRNRTALPPSLAVSRSPDKVWMALASASLKLMMIIDRSCICLAKLTRSLHNLKPLNLQIECQGWKPVEVGHF